MGVFDSVRRSVGVFDSERMTPAVAPPTKELGDLLAALIDKLEKTGTAAPGQSPTRCPVKSAAPTAGPGAPSEARSNVLSGSR